MTTHTRDETSPLLRQLREVADSDEAGDGGSKADATDLRLLADILAERRYADAYRHYRSLDTWVRDGVPGPIVKVLRLHALGEHTTYALTVDAAWSKIRTYEINTRLTELGAEAAELRAELAALGAT